MKAQDTKNKEALAKAAPLAVSGILGSQFWAEVAQRLAALETAKKATVIPRPGGNR